MVPTVFEFILPWLSPVAAYSLASLLNQPDLETWPFGEASRLILYAESLPLLDLPWPIEFRVLPGSALTIEDCWCDALQQAGPEQWLVLLHPDILWQEGLLALLATCIQSDKTLVLTCLPMVRLESVLAELAVADITLDAAIMSRWLKDYPHSCQSACDWNSPYFVQEPSTVSFPGGYHTSIPWPLAIRDPYPIYPTDWGGNYLNTYAIRGQSQMALLTDAVGVQLVDEQQPIPTVWPLPQSLRPRAVYQYLRGCSPLQVWFFAHTFRAPDGVMPGEKCGQTPWDWPEQLWRLQDLNRRGWYDVALGQGLSPPDTLSDPYLQQEWVDSWLQTLYQAAAWDVFLAGGKLWKSWWLSKYWPGEDRAREMVRSHPEWGWCAATEFQLVLGTQKPYATEVVPVPMVLCLIPDSCYQNEIQRLLAGLAATLWISSAVKSEGCLSVLMAICLGKAVRWYD